MLSFLAFGSLFSTALGLTVYHRTDESTWSVRGQLDITPIPRNEHEPEGERITSHVKACHLQGLKAEHLVFHVFDPSTFSPFAIDYFAEPIPHDGSCPSSESTTSASFNTTVTVKSSRAPPLPELQKPPTLSPQGSVVEPPVEQTFIQKYWMYIAGFLLVFLLTGPAPEEGGGQKK
ncbi:hypothetical protein DL96DRAFT_1593015 [Flagelloscypha sp. PMI_526]|nr:hypothetical protein DL96DRAFT_1593015 [Flagelloscypha sp. PMI_526]